MNPLQWIILIILVVISVYGVWQAIPFLLGLAYVPTPDRRIRKALKMAGLQPGEVFYDLGAGDGRVLEIAARDFGARAVGIELSPLQCLVARLRIFRAGLAGQATIRWQNFYTARLEDADVVFAYMTSRQVRRLCPHLEQQLKPGARVVTVSFDLEGWQPVKVDQADLVFLYTIPPAPGNFGTYLAYLENS